LLAKALSISLYGLSGKIIEVETDISSNLPAFVLVGLPDASVNEAAARVRAATTNSKLPLPSRRITVNLSPASEPKQGSSFDLAIAISVLAAARYFETARVSSTVYFGELALDGRIKPVLGVLAAVVAAKQLGVEKIVIPSANLREVQRITGIRVVGYDHLTQLVADLGVDVEAVPAAPPKSVITKAVEPVGCFSEVVGQEEAVSAMKIAAVGGHHILMVGPPGAGKTMLASRLPGILPRLSEEHAIEVGAICSLAGQDQFEFTDIPPIQSPHHTASLASMLGGGSSKPRPGLISLAHRGVLFLDEAPEFQSPVLEALRQPLESGKITISRSSGQAVFPAKFQLVLAANPCPCGFASGTGKDCKCSSGAKVRYLSKISGPLADRIDLRLQLNPINAALVTALIPTLGETSEAIQRQVVSARKITASRLKNTPWKLNSDVAGSYLRRELRLSHGVTKQLDYALDQRLISMRGYDRCLRLAWSISDLAGRDSPKVEDVSLASFYRGADL
jgi:magnesium chelatase family protein